MTSASDAGGTRASESPAEDLLRLENVTVRFGGRAALDSASLAVRRGEVHAIVGQNGSGKSTLIKVLAGIHTPVSGRLLVEGQELSLPPSSHELIRHRVSFVHQDLGLIDALSVTDNICIGKLEHSRFLRYIDAAKQAANARRVLGALGSRIDENAKVATLSPALRTMVAMARGLLVQGDRPGLIVLDEATRTLTEASAQPIYDAMRSIAAAGGGVLVISHNLEEVLAIADRVTVLRDGRVVAAGVPVAELDEREIARLMLGHDVSTDILRSGPMPSGWESHVTISGVRGRRVDGVAFTVGHGEIVGITGLEGSGFEDVPYLVSGALAASAGTVTLATQTLDLTRMNVLTGLRAGIVVVPEERHRDGIALSETVEANVSLPRISLWSRRWWLARDWQRREAREVIQRLGVSPPDPQMPAGRLSGGNQQKVLVGKWILNDPTLLFLHEPTQAVDVGARMDILSAVRGLTSSGVAIVLVSREAADLVAICDRVLIFRDGRIAEELVASHPDDIIEAVYGTPRAALGPIQTLERGGA